MVPPSGSASEDALAASELATAADIALEINRRLFIFHNSSSSRQFFHRQRWVDGEMMGNTPLNYVTLRPSLPGWQAIDS